ncbi:M48 family metalloprotease [Nocardia concava]|uniref:M48 family metalloprotease n=1 Tax=Nocardia concava TaxID=257281 RepID=UPI0002DB4597|nr:M48 family metalloprotease [Nocardia concava]
MIAPRLESASIEDRAAYRRQIRLRAVPWTVAMLLVSWPVPLQGGLLLYRLGDLAGRWAGILLLCVWLLSAFPVLHPPRLPPPMAAPGLPRRPTADESTVLDPAWSDTVHRLGLDESCYDVLVREDGPLGTAYPGGSIIVSTEAIHDLSPAELRGLLGHEIGHFVGDGGFGLYRLSRWYTGLLTLPPNIVCRWVLRMPFPAEWARLTVVWFVRLGWLVGWFTALDNCFGPAVTVGFAVAAIVQGLGQLAILRRDQTHADRVAVDLGFGPGLASMTRRRNPPDPRLPSLLHQRRRRYRALALLLRSLLRDPVPEQRIADIEALISLRDVAQFPGQSAAQE